MIIIMTMVAAATDPRRSRRPARPLACLLVASGAIGPGRSYAPPAKRHSPPRDRAPASLPARRSNWEDDFSSSRADAGLTRGGAAAKKPAWQENAEYWAEREALEELNGRAGGGGGGRADGGNTFARMYAPKSTDEFKKPYDPDAEENDTFAPSTPPAGGRNDQSDQPPAWFGSNERQGGEQRLPQSPASASADPGPNPKANRPQGRSTPPQAKSFNPNTHRHPFQTSSTEDFKRPHGMPPGMEQQQQPPRRIDAFKAPFQTSTTADFRTSSDVASGVGAPQQPLYRQFQKRDRSEDPAWRNGVGRDTYGSTLDPRPPSRGFQGAVAHAQSLGEQARDAFRSMRPPKFTDATIVDDQPQQQQQPAAPTTDFEEWDARFRTASAKSSRMMIGPVKWPLARDPPGVASDHPLFAMRLFATMFGTLSTRYLHLHAGHSPVLASSAMTLLVSTCVDRRLGQAALCGSLAGMSGGHLTPDLPMAAALGAVTSACYELLIRINGLSSGLGGRLGATAFLATSLMAKYQGVRGVGRKLRRGLWSGRAGLSDVAASMILCYAAGSAATVLLRASSDDGAATADPVGATAAVGLLGALFLRDAPAAALALYGGSLAGTSAPARLADGWVPGDGGAGAARQPRTAAALLGPFAAAGAMAGLVHAWTIHAGYWNGGWGGKVGLCAFAGCWAYRCVGNVAQFARRRT